MELAVLVGFEGGNGREIGMLLGICRVNIQVKVKVGRERIGKNWGSRKSYYPWR